MQSSKWIGGVVALAMIACDAFAVMADEPQSPPSVAELARRLDAAEAEIAALRKQLVVSAAAPRPHTPESAIQPASKSTPTLKPPVPAESPSDMLADRVTELENRLHTQDVATKKSEFPTVKVRGRADADVVFVRQNNALMRSLSGSIPNGDLQDGVDFRRARLGVEGWLLPNAAYTLEMDFAGSARPSFTDVSVTFSSVPLVGNLRIGQTKEPFLLEEVTSESFVTFMERSLPDAFAPARNLGVLAFDTLAGDSATWAVGLFKTGSDEFGDEIGDNGENAVTTRFTWLPFFDDCCGGRRLLHLGAAYSFRDADEGVVSFASRPEISLRTSSTGIGGSGEGAFPNFVSTGAIPADDSQLFGAEAALVWGSLSIQSEYVVAVVNRSDISDHAAFQGGYVFASYFLTGEHRPYNRKLGAFDRVRPLSNFAHFGCDDDPCGGWGAWELRARYSWLDLTDADIRGGDLRDLTFGVTWYLSPNLRMLLDYIHSNLAHRGDGGAAADIVAMRLHFDF